MRITVSHSPSRRIESNRKKIRQVSDYLKHQVGFSTTTGTVLDGPPLGGRGQEDSLQVESTGCGANRSGFEWQLCRSLSPVGELLISFNFYVPYYQASDMLSTFQVIVHLRESVHT